MSIILQINLRLERINYPFKFNLVWLEEVEFVELVKNFWGSLRNNQTASPILTLISKLTKLKDEVIKWEKEKKMSLKIDLF